MTGHRLLGLGGTAEIRVMGACPEDFLRYITLRGLRFKRYRKTDELTALLTIPRQGLPMAREAAKKTMCSLEIMKISGALPLLAGMKLRLILPGALLLLTLSVFALQDHIWFFRVEGNSALPERKILEALEDCGVGFFARWDRIELNTVKNQMLSALPELGWITINEKGGVATVVVRERTEKPAAARDAAPANLVARKRGLITSVTVTGGAAAVSPGDMVTEGQLLISGVTNLDKTLLLTRAEGEVYARTWTPIRAVLPERAEKKVYTGAEKRTVSLTFGKKTINLRKTSGISYGTYDKITKKKPLTLPGGYTLPLTLTETVYRAYTLEPLTLPEEQARAILETAALGQLRAGLTAGQLLGSRFSLDREPGRYVLTGTAECREEISLTADIKD